MRLKEIGDYDHLNDESGRAWMIVIKGWHDLPTEVLLDCADEIGYFAESFNQRDESGSSYTSFVAAYEEQVAETGPFKVRQVYAAKLQTSRSREEDWAYEFREYAEPGRGRFKCTVVARPDRG